MTAAVRPGNGPTTREYIETRLNLITEKMRESDDIRKESIVALSE